MRNALAAIFAAVIIFALAPASAQTLVVTRFDSVTTDAISIDSGNATSIDLQAASGLSDSDWAQATVNTGRFVYRLSIVTQGAVTDGRVNFNTAATTATLDGSTPALTGLVAQEGEHIFFTPTGKYLNMYSSNGNNKVSVVRVR